MSIAEQVRCLLAAANQGSLSAAAEVLHESQSRVLEQIRRLEAQIGSTLIQRLEGSVILTAAALKLLPDRRLVSDPSEDEDPGQTPTLPVVSVGICSVANYLLLEDLLGDFRAHHPHVTVRCFGLTSGEVARAVVEERLDIGLVALPLDENGIEMAAGPWRSEAVYWSTDRSRAPRVLDDLAMVARDLVLPQAHWGDIDQAHAQFSRRTPGAGIRITVETHAAALRLAARGTGDTIAPLPLVHQLGFATRLVGTSLEPPLVESLALVVRRGSNRTPAVQLVVQRMAEHLTQAFSVSIAPLT